MSDEQSRIQGQKWEYGRLTRERVNTVGQWTHFTSEASMSEAIRSGGPFPPNVLAQSDEQQWARTVAWLGGEGWELVGVATEPQNERLELWFKRPLDA